jgi:outer membrane protein assembly factor BamA
VRNIWGLIAGRYHSKGYLDFSMTPNPEFDEAAGVVNYSVDIHPGPVYRLALLKFDNVSEDLRKLLMRNWQMFPGDPFDESYVAGFIYKAQTSDPVLQRTLAGVKVSYDVRADPTTHDVNLVIRLERR